MRLIAVIALLLCPAVTSAETEFMEMLSLAEKGDSMARVVVGYALLQGRYRDGTPVERDINAAFAWASLANYQGNPEAQALLDRVIPALSDREAANKTAGEYFKRFGAERNSYGGQQKPVREGPPHNKPLQTDDPEPRPSPPAPTSMLRASPSA